MEDDGRKRMEVDDRKRTSEFRNVSLRNFILFYLIIRNVN